VEISASDDEVDLVSSLQLSNPRKMAVSGDEEDNLHSMGLDRTCAPPMVWSSKGRVCSSLFHPALLCCDIHQPGETSRGTGQRLLRVQQLPTYRWRSEDGASGGGDEEHAAPAAQSLPRGV